MGMNTMLYRVKYSSVDFNESYFWCKNNCSENFYHGTDWNNYVAGESIIEFENEKDAVMFALSFL
jgi:hypothetical protein